MSKRVGVVFCERIDNQSFCVSLVEALSEHYELRCCGPNWPAPDLDAVDTTDAEFYLELDSASGRFDRPTGLERLRVPKFAWLIDTHKKPAFHRAVAEDVDHVFYAMRTWGHVFRRSASWLPLYADTRIFNPVEHEPDLDLVFCGSHTWRADPLREIAAAHDLRLEVLTTTGPEEKSQTAEAYARSKLVFNRHVGNDLNFRVFEAMACGRPLLTDAQWNGQYELFEDDRHYVLYKDQADLEGQILRLLADDPLRERIGKAAAEVARRHHATTTRARQIHAFVEDWLTQHEAAQWRVGASAGREREPAGERESAGDRKREPATDRKRETVAEREPAADRERGPAEREPAAHRERGPAEREPVGREGGAAAERRERLLVLCGAVRATVSQRSYVEEVAHALETERGAECLLTRASVSAAERFAESAVLWQEPPLPREDGTRTLESLQRVSAEQAQLDGVLREVGGFTGILAEGPWGGLVAGPLARRHGLRLYLALPHCEVGLRENRLDREQLYQAELEHEAVESAAQVYVPDDEVAGQVERHYGRRPRVLSVEALTALPPASSGALASASSSATRSAVASAERSAVAASAERSPAGIRAASSPASLGDRFGLDPDSAIALLPSVWDEAALAERIALDDPPERVALVLAREAWLWTPRGELVALPCRLPSGPALAALLTDRAVVVVGSDPREREAEALGSSVRRFARPSAVDPLTGSALSGQERQGPAAVPAAGGGV